ncbi:hypothetical protein LDG_7621 [Legionella drancourtii LLAP12]|uniref:Uncharacterized protein n=1 Tax=Legionella drancourtii LLAP12 TaxID=658187 RepID=G9EQR9_9GAMM|nr:hypothetical protein LDG_7621 [Legionella drancourtii LLAP12]
MEYIATKTAGFDSAFQIASIGNQKLYHSNLLISLILLF